jgi:hypothetical protein
MVQHYTGCVTHWISDGRDQAALEEQGKSLLTDFLVKKAE